MLTILQWIQNAGPIMLVLGGLSVLSLSLILLKVWQFFMLRVEARAFIAQALHAWRRGDLSQVRHTLEGTPNPIAPVLQTVITSRQESALPEDLLREECQRQGSNALHRLRGCMKMLEVIAAISPLLGLLGTVIGIIEAFQALGGAGQTNPAVLAQGIWKALLTTAGGLAVAIPTVVALSAFERVIERFTRNLEDAVTRALLLQPHGNVAHIPQSAEKTARASSRVSSAV
ncbi:MAG TPA: MotA/TolQ/ExbB proton channel family protein, partial [Gammaproteobacteria bacterium]|nr:MotA/TolQ/ExbB proton channel family protein [Gammaproteobacteria bacterium]